MSKHPESEIDKIWMLVRHIFKLFFRKTHFRKMYLLYTNNSGYGIPMAPGGGRGGGQGRLGVILQDPPEVHGRIYHQKVGARVDGVLFSVYGIF